MEKDVALREYLDFDPTHYPHLIEGNACEKKEQWLCPYCLAELEHFMNECDNPKCLCNVKQ